jgi:hypothetical protein
MINPIRWRREAVLDAYNLALGASPINACTIRPGSERLRQLCHQQASLLPRGRGGIVVGSRAGVPSPQGIRASASANYRPVSPTCPSRGSRSTC